jgi:hypothetical protein
MADESPPRDFLSSQPKRARRPTLPWLIAGAVVLAVIAGLLLVGHLRNGAASSTSAANASEGNPGSGSPGGAGLATADAYAAKLTLANIQMSESTSLLGAKQTYIDGTIANHGAKTLTGVTVQVAFNDFTNTIAQKATMPLVLIRTRTPYIDTEAVADAPIKPGETRDFRLIFDHVTEGWNQNYPEIRVIGVAAK